MSDESGTGLTWRERIDRARQREQRWPRFLRFYPRFEHGWPFTGDDLKTWQYITLCAAGRLIEEYGLEKTSDVIAMLAVGNELGRAMMSHDVADAERTLDALEDLALRLKRAGRGLAQP